MGPMLDMSFGLMAGRRLLRIVRETMPADLPPMIAGPVLMQVIGTEEFGDYLRAWLARAFAEERRIRAEADGKVVT